MIKDSYASILDRLLDPVSPGVRFLALRDLVGSPPDDPERVAARRAAHQEGQIAVILKNMHPDGYWSKPGPGYNPKYFSTVWALIMLSQLGASISESKDLDNACRYLLDHALTPQGQFSTNGTPSGTIDCLQGNLCAALVELGSKDVRLSKAFEWMARAQTGEGMAPATEKDAPVRYYAYKCGPNFACGANGHLPCAWGAVKVMLAFGKLPQEQRTPLIQRAIQQGADFLLGVDPATAGYPTHNAGKPNRSWWKFGFPVFYVTDIMQIVESLQQLGYGNDARLSGAIDLIRQKQGNDGFWPLEYTYAGKTWVEFGVMQQPNPWVTLRALKIMKNAGIC